MKKIAQILVIFGCILSFGIPSITFAQVDPALWSMLNELQDELAILYNRANDIQDGVVVEPAMYDSDLALSTCSSLNLYRDLRIGMSGVDVSSLQQFLRSKGYFNAGITGYYGPITASSVQSWKNAHGIGYSSARAAKEYGVVGEIMRAMIQKSC